MSLPYLLVVMREIDNLSGHSVMQISPDRRFSRVVIENLSICVSIPISKSPTRTRIYKIFNYSHYVHFLNSHNYIHRTLNRVFWPLKKYQLMTLLQNFLVSFSFFFVK